MYRLTNAKITRGGRHVILSFKGLMQEDYKLEASLVYIARPCLCNQTSAQDKNIRKLQNWTDFIF